MLELFDGEEDASDGEGSGGKASALELKQSGWFNWHLLPRASSSGKGAASRDSMDSGGGGGTRLLPSSTPILDSLPPSQFDTFLALSLLGSSFLRTSTVA